MAVSIDQEPLEAQPVGNPLVFTYYEATEADYTADDFFFEVELYFNSTLIGTYQRTVESVFDNGVDNDGYGKFDCADILETYISANVRTTDIVTSGSFGSYYIKVRPYTGGAYGAYATSSTRYTWNARLTKIDWIEYINGNIFANTGTGTLTVPWLTQYPTSDNYYVGLEEDVFLYALVNGENFNELRFELFDVNDVSITTATYTFTSAIANSIIANVSPDNIVANTTITDVNFSTCAYYTVVAYDDTGTPVQLTDTYTFHIDTECTRYSSIRFHFLSKIGTIDSYTAKLVNRETRQTKTSGSKSQWGEFVADGTTSNDYTFDLEQGGMNTHLVQSTKRLRVETDWMSEAVQNWLVENLYESPYVVIEQSGTFTKVNITDRSYEIKQRVNIGRIRETITVEYSHGDTSPLI